MNNAPWSEPQKKYLRGSVAYKAIVIIIFRYSSFSSNGEFRIYTIRYWILEAGNWIHVSLRSFDL